MKEDIKSEKERKRRETDSLVKRWASEMSHILTKTRERDWDKLKINNCSSEREEEQSFEFSRGSERRRRRVCFVCLFVLRFRSSAVCA